MERMGETYQRTIKFYYYEPKVYKRINDSDYEWKFEEKFDVRNWLSGIKKEGQIKTNIELSDCFVNLERIELLEKEYWAFRIYKLRDSNIPSIIKEGEEATPIDLEPDEYVGEDTTLLFDSSKCILMMQNNRMSIGKSRLEALMTQSLKDENRRVSLKAISRNIDVSGLKGKRLKTIEFSLENLDLLDEAYNKGGILGSIKALNKYGGYSFSIKISASKKREDTLDANNSLDAIMELTNNKQLVNKAKVRFRDDDKPRVEEIDLLDDVLHDTITFSIENRQPLSFDLAVCKMIEAYKKRIIELKKLLF
ncbi:MAG: hypothetical protein K6G34_13110 [Lachnospiraceae bacterium]|nr:hypothetical protein [Lachnospiraceae bacterium]